MSLASLILAFLSPLAAKLNPKPTKRELELEAEVKRLTFALDYWRTAYNALWDETIQRSLDQQQALSLDQQNALYAHHPLSHEINYLVCNCTPGRAQIIAP
jgi:hypothetical protein